MHSTFRTLVVRPAAVLVALTAMLALVMSPAPARADGHAWDYLLPAPGVCGPVESDPNAAPADQMAAGLCLANAARANYQRGRLNPLGTLQIAAYFKASDVLRCQTGDPHTACGRLMDYWFRRYTRWGDCPSGAFAENIYWGSGSLGTAREAVRWWLNSDLGHRRALLDPQYAYQGMNLKKGTYQGYPNAQVWVHYLCR